MKAMASTASTNAPTAMSSVVINCLLVTWGRSPSATLSQVTRRPTEFFPTLRHKARAGCDLGHRIGGRREKRRSDGVAVELAGDALAQG